MEKKDLAKLEKPNEDLAELNEMFEKSYDPVRFKLANNKSFLQKLELVEDDKKRQKAGFNFSQFFKNFQMPLFLLLGSLLTFYVWKSVPFTVVFRQLTLSEYTIQKGYWHTLLISALSFKASMHMLIYYMPMFMSLVLLSRRMTISHFTATFLANSVISSMVTLIYEKKYSDSTDKLMAPKTLGPCTSLMYSACLSTIGFNVPVFGLRNPPMWIIPTAYLVYEAYSYKESEETSITRPAHFAAIVNGLIFGAILKRYSKLYNL